MKFFLPFDLVVEIATFNDFVYDYENVSNSEIVPRSHRTGLRNRWLLNSQIERDEHGIVCAVNGIFQTLDDKPSIKKRKAIGFANVEVLACSWISRGKFQREDDKPAQIFLDSQVLGNQSWLKEGRFHRTGGKPAIITSDGERHWYIDGKQHRGFDKPAETWGSKSVWFDGNQIHREDDKPAWVWENEQRWFWRGNLHREGDKYAYTGKDWQVWITNGKEHRDGDKPFAINEKGDQEWVENEIIHREHDKPSRIDSFGKRVWFRMGTFVKVVYP
jgi:hypothetical protein